MNARCHGCGGILGVDCWNERECVAITEDMRREAAGPAIAQSHRLEEPSQSSTEGLVERLRARANRWRRALGNHLYYGDGDAALDREAASTIETLTAERDEWHDVAMKAGVVVCVDGSLIYASRERADAAKAARDQALAQVGRLREALEPFAEPHFMGDAYVKFVENAREALADLTLTPGIRNEDR